MVLSKPSKRRSAGGGHRAFLGAWVLGNLAVVLKEVDWHIS